MISNPSSALLINAGFIDAVPLIFSIGLPPQTAAELQPEKMVVAAEVLARIFQMRGGCSFAAGKRLEGLAKEIQGGTPLPEAARAAESLRLELARLSADHLAPLGNAYSGARVRFGSGRAASEQLLRYLRGDKKADAVDPKRFEVDALLESALARNNVETAARLAEIAVTEKERILATHISGLLILALQNDAVHDALVSLTTTTPDLFLPSHGDMILSLGQSRRDPRLAGWLVLNNQSFFG